MNLFKRLIGCAACEFILFTIYYRVFFKCIPGWDYGTSRMLLMCLISLTIVIVITLWKSIKRKRYKKVAILITCPFVIYNMMAYCKVCPYLTIAVTAGALMCTVAYIRYFVKHKPKTDTIRRFVAGVMMICTLWGLIHFGITGVFHLTSVSLPVSTEKDNNTVANTESMLDEHIELVAKTDASSWGKLNLEEKEEVLQVICDIECNYLGIPDYKIKFRPIKQFVLGYTDEQKKEIVINLNYLESDQHTGDSFGTVVLHECFHAYQKQIVKLYEETPKEFKDMLLFENAQTYKHEFDNYTSGKEDFETYKDQTVEVDARAYSEWGWNEDYKKRIQKYLNQKVS